MDTSRKRYEVKIRVLDSRRREIMYYRDVWANVDSEAVNRALFNFGNPRSGETILGLSLTKRQNGLYL